MSEMPSSPHDGREPVCECDDPDPDDVGVGPIDLVVCTKCSGVIR